jgi:nucleotide-binding universal stress UspA family protein
MSAGDARGAVVVGVDATGATDHAVDWAAAEAAARGCPLHLVHVFRQPFTADAFGMAAPVEVYAAVARQVLRSAMRRARAVAPDLELSARWIPGSVVRALLDEAGRAGDRGRGLLVLGGGRRRGVRGLLPGSVPASVAARSSCPVVVIRTAGGVPQARTPPRVVVGVDEEGWDGTPFGTAATGFAFRAAAQRGIPLAVVHAHLPARRTEAGSTAEAACARWRAVFPGVPVLLELVVADPADALVVASDGAALVVVGSRGRARGRFAGAVLGAVGQSVLDRARSPIAVVRHDGVVTPRWAGRSRRGSASSTS